MTTKKQWLGAVAALLMAAGCGGDTSPEEACDSIVEATRDADDRLRTCLPPGETFSEQVDRAACVQALGDCSEEDIENGLDQLNCTLDAFTCESFEDEAAANETLEKIEKCERDNPVSAACDAGDVSGNSAARKALKRLLPR